MGEWGIEEGFLCTEAKAKVVAAVWGTELIQFLAVLAILHQDDLKQEMTSSYSSYRPGAIHPILQIWCKKANAAKKLILSTPQAAAVRPFSSLLSLALFYGKNLTI